jgi:hypothetical protein
VKIYSLSHLLQIARNLPDPQSAQKAHAGYSPVLRVQLDEADGVGYTDPGELTANGAPEPYVEFEIMQWTDANGVSRPRWVLRGLVAM